MVHLLLSGTASIVFFNITPLQNASRPRPTYENVVPNETCFWAKLHARLDEKQSSDGRAQGRERKAKKHNCVPRNALGPRRRACVANRRCLFKNDASVALLLHCPLLTAHPPTSSSGSSNLTGRKHVDRRSGVSSLFPKVQPGEHLLCLVVGHEIRYAVGPRRRIVG